MSSIISPYALTSTPIQGNLNYGQAAAGANLFQGTAVGGSFADSYKGSLALNSDLYNKTLSGYQQNTARQAGTQQQILGGWNQLNQNVMGMLGLGGGNGAVGAGGTIDWSKVDPTKGAAGIREGAFGIGTGAARAMANTFVSNQGNVTQQMQSAGLGNTTAMGNAYNQNAFQSQEALGNLGNMLAQTGAGYASQLGQGALNYANQANMQNTAENNLQLKFMQDTQIPYPSAAAYGSVLNYLANRGRAGSGGQAVVNPFGSGQSSQGHIPFGPGMPSPPGAAQGQGGQGYRPPPAPQNFDVATEIARSMGLGANAVSSQTLGDLQNFVNSYTQQGTANEAANADQQVVGYDDYGQPIYQNAGGGQYQSPNLDLSGYGGEGE